MTMFPSACIWTCRTPIDETLRQIERTAFHYVDVEPDTLDAPAAQESLKSLGLKVSCVALDHKLPPGSALDGKNAMRGAMDYLKRALQKAQDLGARTTYVGSCADRRHLKAFGSAIAELAGDAAQKTIKLCIEHIPGRAISTAKEALSFLNGVNHPNAFLLLDIGHTILSKEKAWEIIPTAGDRLGYIHLNDNDGKKDRHWPLLDGRLTADELKKILEALNQAGYDSTLGLELSEIRPGVMTAFAKNRNLLLRLQAPVEPKSLKEPELRRKQ
jgi:sugar phosphate isomerase/epimerase